jgi:hypothetical protein
LKVIERKEIETYPPLMGLLATIRWNIEARAGQVKEWEPPRVVVGSEKQWELSLEKNVKGYQELDDMEVDEERGK